MEEVGWRLGELGRCYGQEKDFIVGTGEEWQQLPPASSSDLSSMSELVMESSA